MSRLTTTVKTVLTVVAVWASMVCPVMGADVRVVNSLGMVFIHIPAGTFMMGSPAEEPGRDSGEALHQVRITRDFYMQATEVTLSQWWFLMGKKMIGRRKGDPNMPVTRVSWYDAQDFISRLNGMNQGVYRLPSEAEWEYACRAGSATAYAWGDTIDCTRAVYGNNTLDTRVCVSFYTARGIAPDMPAPVKSFAPNAWGIYDMHGNVWEWCMDCYVNAYPPGKGTDPMIDRKSMNKIRRGGSWFKGPEALRSANRAYAHASARFQTTGFRLVMEPGPR